MAGKTQSWNRMQIFQRILYKVVHGYLGRFVGVILEGNKFIKIYLSHRYEEKKN